MFTFTKHLSSIISLSLLAAFCFSAQTLAQNLGEVKCANLIYGKNQTSVCFSSDFMDDIDSKTNINTDGKFTQVRLDSDNLFEYPFSVMTGEGKFKLSPKQQESLKTYLTHGGFVVASSGCSCRDWASSFETEIRKVFPENRMKKVGMDHPIFHSYFDIHHLEDASGGLKGLEVDGKIVLIFSSDGLNDSSNADNDDCCCCGGSEIDNARKVNVNLLVYALTH